MTRKKEVKGNIRLGISPTLWQGQQFSFDDCCRDMRAAGFSGCELREEFNSRSDLKKDLNDHGLTISTAMFATYFTVSGKQEETLEKFDAHCRLLESLGSNIVVITESGHSIYHSQRPIFSSSVSFDHQQWLGLFNGINKLISIANNYGLKIAYYPHMGTGVQTDLQIKFLMQHTPKELSLVFDPGQLFLAGVGINKLLEDYAYRISHIYLKDVNYSVFKAAMENNHSYLQAVKNGIFTIPGEGCMNLSKLINWLRSDSYSGWVVLESGLALNETNALQQAKLGREFIKTELLF